MALGLREAGFGTEFIGVDQNPEHEAMAMSAGWIDRVLPLEQAIEISNLIIVSIPVGASKKLLPVILDKIDAEAVVMDVGSTKGTVCQSVETHPRRGQFVASHPIAGTENSGPTAAISSLFTDKKGIICEKGLSDMDALLRVEQVYQTLGMDILYMSAEEHDMHLAYISHVSHISSFSLALSVLKAEKDERRIFQFAGSGFDSTARLAKSSPQMWNPVFIENKNPILKVLDEYIDILSSFRKNIAEGNEENLIQQMTEANEIRRILDGQFITQPTIPLKQ